jgi:hypothetical protein
LLTKSETVIPNFVAILSLTTVCTQSKEAELDWLNLGQLAKV